MRNRLPKLGYVLSWMRSFPGRIALVVIPARLLCALSCAGSGCRRGPCTCSCGCSTDHSTSSGGTRMTLCTSEPWNCGASPASGGVDPVMRMIGT